MCKCFFSFSMNGLYKGVQVPLIALTMQSYYLFPVLAASTEIILQPKQKILALGIKISLDLFHSALAYSYLCIRNKEEQL